MTEPDGQTARDVGLELEDEGIPDLQDGTPAAAQAEDPEFMPVPGDRPGASADFGTTAAEQAEGESLAGRLDREQPDDAADVRRSEDPDHALTQLGQDDATTPPTESATERTADDVEASAAPAVGGEGPEEDAMHLTD
jgi:hypothetical protein